MKSKSLAQFKKDHVIFFQNGKGKGERYNVYRGYLLTTARDEYTGWHGTKVWCENEVGTLLIFGKFTTPRAAKLAIDDHLSFVAMVDHCNDPDKLADLFTQLPPKEWERVWLTLNDAQKMLIMPTATQIQQTAIKMIRAAVYFETRAAHQGHDSAVQLQNEMTNNVRKALSFIGNDDITF